MSPGVKRPNEMSIHAASAASSVCGFIPRGLRLYRLAVNLVLGESSAGRDRTYDGRTLTGSQVRRSNSAQRSPSSDRLLSTDPCTHGGRAAVEATSVRDTEFIVEHTRQRRWGYAELAGEILYIATREVILEDLTAEA